MVHPFCSMYQYLIPFYHQKIFYFMDLPYFIYPLISWWTFGLFLWILYVDWAMDIVSQVTYGAALSWELGRGSLVLLHACLSKVCLTLHDPSFSNRIAWTSLSMEAEFQESKHRRCHFLRARLHLHDFCYILSVKEVTLSDLERGEIGCTSDGRSDIPM